MLFNFATRLPQRSLLRVRGAEAHEFLQGMFTNDVMLLKPGQSQLGCFLFFTGKVLCDAQLHQSRHQYQNQSAILVEVHENMREELLEHLKEMKMRKKVVIEDVSQQLTVLASVGEGEGQSPADAAETQEVVVVDEKIKSLRNAEHFLDPRSFALLKALTAEEKVLTLATEGGKPQQLFKTIVPREWSPASHELESPTAYDRLLYANGIGEGPAIYRHNKTLPFEANLDFLNGVSFHKGCYVGQELTHRTHVMLVTRKRTVPLYFDLPEPVHAPTSAKVQVGDALVMNGGKEKVGEVTAVSGGVGLGLLRLRYLDKETQTIADLAVKCVGEDKKETLIPAKMEIPAWWPKKALKKILKNNE